MQIASDVKRAKKLAKKVLAGRRTLFGVRELIAERGPLPENRYRVGVYFADSDVNIYQMRQWYAPLQELSKTHPVLLIARHPAGAKLLMEESGLDVAFTQKVTDIEKLLEQQPLEVVLYVNQNTRNFQMMRYGRRWHVFINHGESDKMYMTTNQFKAYDYALIAGDAARERLRRVLWDYDLDARTIEIGRPQADYYSGALPFIPDERTVVLYAPTWEGDRPSAHYGSVRTHGEALAAAVLASPAHRLIYRPHPRSGVVDSEYGAANQRIIAAITAANVADASANHVYDDGADLGWQLAAADLAVVDISAMVYDRLAADRPLLVTRPVDPEALVDTHGYLSDAEWLSAAASERFLEEANRVLSDPDASRALEAWVRHYFGDTAPGAATARFEAAIATLMERWDEWHSTASDDGVDEPDDEVEED